MANSFFQINTEIKENFGDWPSIRQIRQFSPANMHFLLYGITAGMASDCFTYIVFPQDISQNHAYNVMPMHAY